MQAWWFTEDCYPYLPKSETYRSIRVDLPNIHCDPEVASDLYNQYLDLWCACDEIGLEIMLNEHHQTATCMVPSAPIMLGILARQTNKARLLILGNPLPNRNQPVRVAEEMAMVDVISKGRVEGGFVRGVGIIIDRLIFGHDHISNHIHPYGLQLVVPRRQNRWQDTIM